MSTSSDGSNNIYFGPQINCEYVGELNTKSSNGILCCKTHLKVYNNKSIKMPKSKGSLKKTGL